MAVPILVSTIVVVQALFIILLLIGIYQKNTNLICTSKKRLDGKTALVTGGTAGMGLEIAKDFAQRGARVIVACPFEEEGLQALKTIAKNSENHNVVFKLLDLASFKSIRNFAVDILKNEERLDLLINNAGVGGPRDVTADGLDYLMQVNYYGAFLLTILLLPLIKKTGSPGEPSRIVNVSSAAQNLGRVNFDKLDGNYFNVLEYANSKLFLILFSRELTKRLQNCNVIINNADPGAVGTRIFSGFNAYIGFLITCIFFIIFKSPFLGAQTAIHVALDKKAGEVSGEFFKNCKHGRAISKAYDDKTAMKLWEDSVKSVKLTEEELKLCLQ